MDPLSNLILFGQDLSTGTQVALATNEEGIKDTSSVSIRRLYGTVIGISPEIVINCSPLYLDTMFSCKKALHEDFFLPYTWDTPRGSISANLNQIPNGLVGIFLDDVELYVLFPDLHSTSRFCPELTMEEYRIFWEDALGPSVDGLSGESGCEVVTPANLSSLTAVIRVHAHSSENLWLRHMVFVHVVRSQSSRHAFTASAATASLQEYLYRHHLSVSDIRDDQARGGMWFIDVGIEVAVRGHSVMWSLASHEAVYEALTGIELGHRSNSYQPFTIAHITDAGACRVSSLHTPDSPPTPFPLVVLSVTDQTLYSVRECGAHNDDVSVLDIVDCPSGSQSFLKRVAHLYLNNSADMRAQGLLRMSLDIAETTLLDVDTGVIVNACLSFPTPVISKWRGMRLYCLDHIVEKQREQAPFLSARLEMSIFILAVVRWLLRTIHTGLILPASEDCTPLVVSDPRCGLLFLPDMSFGNDAFDVPHFVYIDPSDYLSGEGLMFEDAPRRILDAFMRPNNPVPTTPRALPAPNGFRPYRASIPSFVHPLPYGLFKSTIYFSSELREDYDGPDGTEDPTTWCFAQGIFQCWMEDVIDDATRFACVRPEPMANFPGGEIPALDHNLAKVFLSVGWKHATAEEWARTFERFFPLKPPNPPSIAPHSKWTYYGNWLYLIDEGGLATMVVRLIRRTLWHSIFKSLYWIPAFEGRSAWSTGVSRKFRVLKSTGAPTTGILKVLINGASNPTFNVEAI